MSDVPIPYDEESAEKVLGRFMENAFSSQYEERFLKAVTILHGPYFVIKRDQSKRMFFKCVLCNKDLNNIRGLKEHIHSGAHNKNKDEETTTKAPSTSSKNYHPSSLRYKVSQVDSASPVLGLQMVEEYDDGRNLYYKCILCAAHGRVDPMFKHILGDKHTDKYIRARIRLNTPVITGEERALLRRRIWAKEHYNEQHLVTIKGRRYYPHKWEDEMRKGNFKAKSERESGFRSTTPHAEEGRFSPLESRVKKEVHEDAEIEEIEKQTLPTSVRKEPVAKSDKSIQAYSLGFLENILLKFNVIVQAHNLKDTDLHSREDLKAALAIIRYALHLLYYINQLDKSSNNEVLRSCLGYVMQVLIPFYERKYKAIDF